MKNLLALFLVCYISGGAQADSVMDTCPRLEGTNLKCTLVNPPGPPPGSDGDVGCTPTTKSIPCHYYATAGTIVRAVTSSICTNYTCEITNSPEGLPRYQSQCTDRSSCCDVQTIGCFDGQMSAPGTASTDSSCNVTISCPSIGGMSSGGEDAPTCDTGNSGPTTCGDAPSCSVTGGGQPCGPS